MIRYSLTFFVTLVLTATSSWASAKEAIPNRYQPYVSLLQAQKRLHDAEYQSAAHRLQTLESLKAAGHASWLEVRRQKLKANGLQLKTQMYDQFLSHAQTALAETKIEFDEDPAWAEAQIHFTDLNIRMGNELSLSPEQIAGMVEELNQELKEQNEQVLKLAAASGSVYVPTHQHRLNIAQGQLAVTQARIQWLQSLPSEVAPESLRKSASRKNFYAQTTKAHSEISEASKIKSAAVKQCEAHTALVEYMLSTEEQRLGKVRELKAMSMASQEDINLLENKIATLHEMKDEQLTVSQFLKSAKTRQVDVNQNQQSSVTQMRGGFQKFEAEFQLKAATLEKDFLTEVLVKLEQAVQLSAMNQTFSSTNGLAQTLKIGQQNEIKNYQNQIRLAELKAELAECRIEVIELQNQQSSLSEFVVAPSTSTDGLMMALNSMSLMTQFLTVAESPEFLLESMVHRSPIGSLPTQFRDFDINYRPIQLTSSTRSFSPSYRPSRSRTASRRDTGFGTRSHVWTYQYGSGLSPRRNYGSPSLYGFSSSSKGRYASHQTRPSLGGLTSSSRINSFGSFSSRQRNSYGRSFYGGSSSFRFSPGTSPFGGSPFFRSW